jgi:hypothetical protein
MNTERKPLRTQLREQRECMRMSLEIAANRARMTVEQVQRVEAGLSTFQAARAYAVALGKRVTVRGFHRQKYLTALGLASALGMSRNTVSKCIRIAYSPGNMTADDSDCELVSLESVVEAWSPTAMLILV